MKTLAILFLITIGHVLTPGSFKVFKDESKSISIELPKNWYFKTIDDNKTIQMFVSLEEIKKAEDVFSVGVTITKIRRMSKSFPEMKTDNDIFTTWYITSKRLLSEHYEFKELSLMEVKMDNYSGLFMESIFQVTEHDVSTHMYQYTLAKDDNLITLIFESPEEKWSTYKNIFDQAITTIKLK